VAQDYYAAGVLGHAEEVLVKALEDADDQISRQAFRLWLAILESEQDWERAVTLVEQYGMPGSGGLRLANLYSEYVVSQWRERPKSELLKVLKKARRLDVSSRVELLIAELLNDQGSWEEAIQVYRNVLLSDPRRVNLVLPTLKHLSIANATHDELIRFLIKLYRRHPSVRILEVLLEIYNLEGIELPTELETAVAHQVRAGDSTIVLKCWRRKQPQQAQQTLDEIMPALQQHSLSNIDDNVCMECGFHSEKMVWLCPQCESWETMYSRYELRIEQQIKKAT
jgi:lipopolysaccharide biosynthesis regulator YciM